MARSSPQTLDSAAFRKPWKDRVTMATVWLVGITLSVLAGTALREAEALRARELRTAATQTVVAAFDLDLTRIIEAVRGAGLMIEANPTLSQQQFNGYVERLLSNLQSINVVEWQPIVPAAQLKQFEASARANGMPQYQVRQPNREGNGWDPVHGRETYVPVLYAWPNWFGTHGNDMAINPEHMQSKLEARVAGLPVASQVFDIARKGSLVPSGSKGIALSVPVYGAGDHAVIGYVSAVIDLPTLFQESNARADSVKMDLLVYDRSAQDAKPIYAWSGGQDPVGTARVVERQELPGDTATTLDFAHRAWEIVLRPRAAFESGRANYFSTLIMAFGLVTTGLLALAVARVQRSRRSLQKAQVLTQQARDTLASERQRLHNIIEATDAGTWSFNYSTGKMEVNERWASMFGMALSEWDAIPSYTWKDYCHPDDQPHVLQALRQATRGLVDQYEAEYRHLRKDNSYLWVASKGKVLSRDANGKPLIFAGTLTDITLRKEAQAHIVELNATLENRVAERTAQLESALHTLHHSQEELSKSEARATLGTLAASVSHELATPMGNSIMTASTMAAQTKAFEALLASGTLRRSSLTEFVEHVAQGNSLLLRNLERATDLLKNFRQVAADQASEQRRNFDLQQAIQEVVDTLAPSLKAKPHRVVLDIPADIAMDSYPGPLGQVVINLINNAYLHAFDEQTHGQFTIAAQPDGESVHLRFQDNGKGISAETLQHMFEPFFSTKIGKGGTGLGMSIVENLVSKTLGGTVSVKSTVGEGTVVTVTIPRSVPSAKGE